MIIFKQQKAIYFSLIILAAFFPQLASAQGLENPLGNITSLEQLLTQVVRIFLGIMAFLATIMVIWGGFTLMTSGGNSEKVQKGKDTLVWALLGLAVVFLSWAIVKFVFDVIVT